MPHDQPLAYRERAQPHWLWVIGAVLVPLALLLVSVLGLTRGSFVSTDVAAVVPSVALAVSIGVTGVALARRSRAALIIAVFGLLLTVLGVLWLRWVGA